eukprot:TRINITY_DN4165_c0_g1_i3.p1 TRINITY_DN4165_c0_g1~~TRINITY_DN4165_c0_g1_i3.p1  ORF type:complete len:426 (-),score=85.63 TRINITY_DN4165_c0_g1_i3:427-1635(-)
MEGQVSDYNTFKSMLKNINNNDIIGTAYIAIQTICLYVQNIIKNPSETKFLRIPRSNKNFQWRVEAYEYSEMIFMHLGFVVSDPEDPHSFLVWAGSDMKALKVADELLNDFLDEVRDELFSIPRKSLNGYRDKGLSSELFQASVRFSVGYSDTIGRRSSMEDDMVILGMGPRLRANEDFFAVYDGHGGKQVARYLGRELHKHLAKFLYTEDIEEALKLSFSDANELLNKRLKEESGSTAIVAFIVDNEVYVANCGDSRAVLGKFGRQSERVSLDHKPGDPVEKARIEELGGKVLFIQGVPRVNGLLGVARAFGDKSLQPYVTSEPAITKFEITEDTNFLILACDGLWDEVTDIAAVSLVYECETPHEAAHLLMRTALDRYSTDNISIIVIFLRDRETWEDRS